jgi:hypothetical protein
MLAARSVALREVSLSLLIRLFKPIVIAIPFFELAGLLVRVNHVAHVGAVVDLLLGDQEGVPSQAAAVSVVAQV